MEGAPKRQLNAEEMLAELKRALESPTRPPDAPPTSVSTAPKASSPRREPRRSHWGIDPPIKASADSSIGKPTDLQKSVRPSSHRRKLTAAGLALGGAAAFFAGALLMNQVLNRPAHEFSAAATEEPVRPRDEQALQPSRDPRSPIVNGQQAAPLPAGVLETRPGAGMASANNGSVPAGGKEVDAPNLASSGLETTAPAFTPALLNSAAVFAPSQRIGPDGAPIASAPSAPASADSAPPLAQTPKPAAAPAAPQMVRPDKAAIATAPPTPASADSAHPAETPKPDATQTASRSNESAEPSTPKIDSRKKPSEKPSAPKPAKSKSAKASAKSVAQAERQSAKPSPPKEAERSPEPPQGGVNPAVAPVAAPSVQQRVADGMGHAFGYLMHLPGALVPHFGGSNPSAQ